MTQQQSHESGEQVVRLECQLAAPVERVFRAWHDPKDLEAWSWGSLSRDVKAEVDCRVGGQFRVETGTEKGDRFGFVGTFEEITPSKRLVYRLQWEVPMGYDSPGERVIVDFTGEEGGSSSSFVMQHEGVPIEVGRAEHAKGWADTFKALRKLVEEV